MRMQGGGGCGHTESHAQVSVPLPTGDAPCITAGATHLGPDQVSTVPVTGRDDLAHSVGGNIAAAEPEEGAPAARTVYPEESRPFTYHLKGSGRMHRASRRHDRSKWDQTNAPGSREVATRR